MFEITEATVIELGRISSTATYGYHGIQVVRRSEYTWDNPEIPIYTHVGGASNLNQTWKDPRMAAAFLVGCIRAGLETRDDFQLTAEDQATVDRAAAAIPNEGDYQFWMQYGTTNSIGRIRGVQEGQMQDIEMWDVQQVADHLGIAPASVRRQMSRWEIQRVSTGQSEAGRVTALYNAAKVRSAHAARPGRGARTDLPTA